MSAASCGITIVHPIIDANEISNPIIRSIRSIPIFNFEEFHHNANHVIVVVDTENAGVMMWKIDIRSTLLKSSLSAPAESCSIHQPNLPSVVAIKSYFSLNGLGSLLSLYPSSSNLVKLGGDITMVSNNDLLFCKLNSFSFFPVVTRKQQNCQCCDDECCVCSFASTVSGFIF